MNDREWAVESCCEDKAICDTEAEARSLADAYAFHGHDWVIYSRPVGEWELVDDRAGAFRESVLASPPRADSTSGNVPTLADERGTKK